MSGLTVLVVEDHLMIAEALALLLKGRAGISSVDSVGSGEAALAAAKDRCPNVVIMDVDLPGIDGIEATRRLLEVCPQSRVVVMTALETGDVLDRIVEAGATGFVPKTQAADRLIEVISRAAAGEVVLPPESLPDLVRHLRGGRQARSEAALRIAELSSREIEVLRLLGAGRTTQEIAAELFISPHTVHGHVRSILSKLGVRSKLEAVLFALRHDVIRLEERNP